MALPGTPPPGRAQVVVIGGGVVGCSVAYHLAQRGVTDVAVIERHASLRTARPGTRPG